MPDQLAGTPPGAGSALWAELLPVIQQISSYGGNRTCAFLSRSVIEEINRLANDGDATLSAKHAGIHDALRRGKWPYDPTAFNAIFETYHEALFYLVAASRGVELDDIAEGDASTTDFSTRVDPKEHFEVKTIDFAGGQYAYKAITEGGLDEKIKVEVEARSRGVGVGAMVLNPHGKATNSREAIEQVMRQIAGNVKESQFRAEPIFLVLPMIRTALHTRAEDLAPTLTHPVTGSTVSGHLWTIATHQVGALFSSSESAIEHDVAPLNRGAFSSISRSFGASSFFIPNGTSFRAPTSLTPRRSPLLVGFSESGTIVFRLSSANRRHRWNQGRRRFRVCATHGVAQEQPEPPVRPKLPKMGKSTAPNASAAATARKPGYPSFGSVLGFRPKTARNQGNALSSLPWHVSKT